MNLKPAKLQQQQKQETTQHAGAQQATREFPSPEELLRHDAEQIEVPRALANRVAEAEPSIDVIHALIWLSLSGYVRNDLDSVLGAFYNGLYYLEGTDA